MAEKDKIDLRQSIKYRGEDLIEAAKDIKAFIMYLMGEASPETDVSANEVAKVFDTLDYLANEVEYINK